MSIRGFVLAAVVILVALVSVAAWYRSGLVRSKETIEGTEVKAKLATVAATYEQVVELKHVIAQDALERGRAAVCSSYRLLMLTEPAPGKFANRFEGALRHILAKQKLVNLETRQLKDSKGVGQLASRIAVAIPAPFGREIWVGEIDAGRPPRLLDLGGGSLYQEANVLCERPYWAPRPVSSKARATEVGGFERVLASAVYRLRTYEGEIERIEDRASALLVKQAELIELLPGASAKLRKPEIVQQAVKEADEVVEEANKTIEGARKAIGSAATFQETELNRIREIFKGM